MAHRRPLFHIVFLLIFLTASPLVADWDSEEDAQAIAEKVVNADFNKNKIVPLAKPDTAEVKARIVGLAKPRILDIQGREASIDDLYALIDDDTANLEESLARLNADVTDTEVRIRLQAAVLFAFDQAVLRPDALEKLEDVITVIDGYPDFPVLIEGHTCSMGSHEYNQKLSVRRANSVKDWLLTNDVSKSRLSVGGQGETQPIADNSEEKGRMQNRRVEIVMRKN